MDNLFNKTNFYEYLLLAYFAESCNEFKNVIVKDLDIIIGRLLEIFAHEDEQRGTNHILLIPKIYSNANFDNLKDYCKSLNICKSTLQRYRKKYCATLKLVMENHKNGI